MRLHGLEVKMDIMKPARETWFETCGELHMSGWCMFPTRYSASLASVLQQGAASRKGKMRQCICKKIVISLDVVDLNSIVFKEESPTENMLSLQLLEGGILVIGVNVDVRATIEHGSKLFESFLNGK